jgi:hypothetical protein
MKLTWDDLVKRDVELTSVRIIHRMVKMERAAYVEQDCKHHQLRQKAPGLRPHKKGCGDLISPRLYPGVCVYPTPNLTGVYICTFTGLKLTSCNEVLTSDHNATNPALQK